VVDFLRKFVPSETEQEARDLAGAFLFQGDEQDKPMSGLSGGERSRAVLASLIVGGHNLLVLDEPTNHLDIASAETLEEALRAFTKPLEGFGENQTGGGTLILITHDRMLLEDLVDQLIILDGHGNVRHFLGTYSKFVEATLAAEATAAGVAAKKIDKDAKVGVPIAAPKKDKKANNAPGKGGGQQINAALSKLSQQALEEKIMELEGALSSLDAQLAKKDTYKDGALVKELQGARDKKKAELGPLEQEWARRTS
jgi:ATP-binding cassette subfamily F protein 3